MPFLFRVSVLSFLILTIPALSTPIKFSLVFSFCYSPLTTSPSMSLHVTLPLILIASCIFKVSPKGTGNTICHARLQLWVYSELCWRKPPSAITAPTRTTRSRPPARRPEPVEGTSDSAVTDQSRAKSRLNQWPIGLQSITLPLSYTPTCHWISYLKYHIVMKRFTDSCKQPVQRLLVKRHLR